MSKIEMIKNYIKNSEFKNLDIFQLKILFILKLIERKTKLLEICINNNLNNIFKNKEKANKEIENILLKNKESYILRFDYKGEKFRLIKHNKNNNLEYRYFSLESENMELDTEERNIDIDFIKEFLKSNEKYNINELKDIEKTLFNFLENIINEIKLKREIKKNEEEKYKETINSMINFFK